ncbi:cupin-like domain-containing protein [Sphingomonas sp. SUN019]|uniref:cupin-like domain-containing protein n=1 Tax=Sphingomonas sp. SUN019 TaxID=2937788 RepID=UPI002164844E|nr:cupin-like domain-containing protein [Sphingomonas sp. SUN019]UVO51278.1 cupin-like domain-containing protein [Sphingomonas sp. SUN019]
MRAISERHGVTPAIFAEIRAASEPVVLRGLVADWPVVRAGDRWTDYLADAATTVPVPVVRAAPEAEGRLHYNPGLTGTNFVRGPDTLAGFLSALTAEAMKPDPDTLAVQAIAAAEVLPGFAAAHPLPLLPGDVAPRLWIGNRARVAIHNDPMENIAVVAAGRRRFTLFAPEQLPNLYLGPFHLTPAGTPVSMVHLTAPDLTRYPRFADALASAQEAELGPGDALYIPYGWYHHVEALEAANLLVNYWWNPARGDVGSPWDALLHGMMTLRNLPADQRRQWQAMFAHYVFLEGGDPAAHIPPHARGILSASEPRDVAQMRRELIAKLQGAGRGETPR